MNSGIRWICGLHLRGNQPHLVMGKNDYTPRDPQVTSRIMSRVGSKDTKPEMILRKALWGEGFRYRIHYNLPGKPDIVFLSQKVVVFCDGAFWHGRDFAKTMRDIKRNKNFWRKKISKTMERDKKYTKELKKLGWVVIRFWDDEILKTPGSCVEKIKFQLQNNRLRVT